MRELFLNPPFAWVAAALFAVPLLIHLLNRRRHRELPWAAMMFLLAAKRKNLRRTRLEHWLLLALRTAAIVVLPLAMARPVLRSAAASGLLGDGRHHIVILDPSLSMSAPCGRRGSAFEHHKRRAAELIDSLPDGDPVTLISAGYPARRLNRQPLFDATRARQLLDTLTQQATHTDLAGALTHVEAILDAEHGELDDYSLHLFSDFTPTTLAGVRLPHADGQPASAIPTLRRLSERAHLTLYQVGDATPANLSVDNIALDSPLVGTRRLNSLRVSLRNHAATRSQPATLELLVDGQLSATLQVPPLDPTAGHDIVSAVEFDTVGLHAVEARLTPRSGNALTLDDQRRIVLRARERIPVLIIDGKPGATLLDGEAGYVATALAPRTQLSESTFIEPTVIAETELAGMQLERFDVLILCNVRRLPESRWRDIERHVRDGRGLILFLGDLVDEAHYNKYAEDILPGQLQGPALRPAPDRPLTRLAPGEVGPALSATFGGRKDSGVFLARIHQYLRLDRPHDVPAGVSLMQYENGDTALAERRVGRGRCVVCTTTANMNWTNLPAKGDFVTLCMSLLDHVAPPSAAQRNLIAGERLVTHADAPNKAALAGSRLRTPSGRTLVPQVLASPLGVELDFGHLEAAGWYTLESAREEGSVAVNVHPQESDLRRLEEHEVAELLQCEYAWTEIDAEGTGLLPAEAHLASSGMLFAVLMLLLGESVAAVAFGHHRR